MTSARKHNVNGDGNVNGKAQGDARTTGPAGARTAPTDPPAPAPATPPTGTATSGPDAPGRSSPGRPSPGRPSLGRSSPGEPTAQPHATPHTGLPHAGLPHTGHPGSAHPGHPGAARPSAGPSSKPPSTKGPTASGPTANTPAKDTPVKDTPVNDSPTWDSSASGLSTRDLAASGLSAAGSFAERHPGASAAATMADERLFDGDGDLPADPFRPGAEDVGPSGLFDEWADMDRARLVVLVPEGWGASLRRFGRATVWALPAGALLLTLGGVSGLPGASGRGDSASAVAWLLFTVGGLLAALLGVVALTALMAASRGRLLALAGLGLVAAGTLALAPVLGVIGVARPAVDSFGAKLNPQLAAELDARFLAGRAMRLFGVGGLVLLCLGCLALAGAIVASRVLNRADAGLLLGTVAVTTVAGLVRWQFLVVLGTMLLLAAGLGLALTASRLTPDRPTDR